MADGQKGRKSRAEECPAALLSDSLHPLTLAPSSPPPASLASLAPLRSNERGPRPDKRRGGEAREAQEGGNPGRDGNALSPSCASPPLCVPTSAGRSQVNAEAGRRGRRKRRGETRDGMATRYLPAASSSATASPASLTILSLPKMHKSLPLPHASTSFPSSCASASLAPLRSNECGPPPDKRRGGEAQEERRNPGRDGNAVSHSCASPPLCVPTSAGRSQVNAEAGRRGRRKRRGETRDGTFRPGVLVDAR